MIPLTTQLLSMRHGMQHPTEQPGAKCQGEEDGKHRLSPHVPDFAAALASAGPWKALAEDIPGCPSHEKEPDEDRPQWRQGGEETPLAPAALPPFPPGQHDTPAIPAQATDRPPAPPAALVAPASLPPTGDDGLRGTAVRGNEAPAPFKAGTAVLPPAPTPLPAVPAARAALTPRCTLTPERMRHAAEMVAPVLRHGEPPVAHARLARGPAAEPSPALETPARPVPEAWPNASPAQQVAQQLEGLASSPQEPDRLPAPLSSGVLLPEVQARAAGNLRVLRLTLKPESLGQVEVILRRTRQDVKIEIAVQKDVVAEALRRDVSFLEDKLRGLLPSGTQSLSIIVLGQDATSPGAQQASGLSLQRDGLAGSFGQAAGGSERRTSPDGGKDEPRRRQKEIQDETDALARRVAAGLVV